MKKIINSKKNNLNKNLNKIKNCVSKIANILEKHNNNSIDYKIAKNNSDINNNDNEPLSFPVALSRFFLEEKTEKSVTSFFEEYQNYLNNIYYQNSPKKVI